jgi:hypothetical protein
MAGHRRWARRASAPRATGLSALSVHPVTAAGTTPAASSSALDELLAEVRELRLTFVADLSSAAGAVEVGATDVAADIIESDRQELARFFQAADERLRQLERAAYRDAPAGTETTGSDSPTADSANADSASADSTSADSTSADSTSANVVPLTAARRSRLPRRVAVALPAVPLVGALTMAAAAAAGILPVPGTSNPTTNHHVISVAADEMPALRQLESVVNGDPSEQQVIDAADKLHQQIAALIATSNGDPAKADAIAELLQIERALLLNKQPPGAQAVLAATRSLITQLRSHATTMVPPPMVSPTAGSVAQQQSGSNSSSSSSNSRPSPTPSATPSKTTKPTPKPTHSASPSPSSSQSSSPSGPLPKLGG